ncbi:MAG: TlpA family protein disulfide reductase [Chloroflexota bacterium]
MRRAAWALVIAVPLVGLLWFGLGRNPNAVADPLLNHRAPAFTLTSLDGRRVSLAHLRGKPVVLNFWASWCTECKNEHSYLLDLSRQYRSRGVTFYGISYQDGRDAARTFLKRYGAPWPDLRDPEDRTALDYGVTGVPETFVIDRTGVLRYHSPGPVRPGAPTTPQTLARQIDKTLRSTA